MKNILFCLFFFFSSLSAADNKIPSLSELSLQECTLQKVISVLDLETINRQASVAKNIISANNEIKLLIAKLPNNNIPINKQLSPENLDKFSVDSQKIRAMETKNLVESRYERDLMVIEKLTETADDFYRWDRVPADNDPNVIYFVLLLAMN